MHAKGTHLETRDVKAETEQVTLNQECKDTWDILKKKLLTAPLLAFSNFNHLFILYCDESKQKGYRAALH